MGRRLEDRRARSIAEPPVGDSIRGRLAIHSRWHGREDTCGRSAEEPPDVDDLAGGELLPGMRGAVVDG